MERILYAAVIATAAVITIILHNLWGDQVFDFLTNSLGPLVQNTVGATGAIVGAVALVIYGLARNNGRLLKELLQKD